MRAGLAPVVVSCGDPGPLPKAGAAPGAELWAAGWEGAGVFAAVGTDGLAVAGGTTAATGLGCADVVVDAAPMLRPAALAGPAGRAGEEEPWAAAGDEDDAAGADESGTDATGRGVDRTVGAEGLGDAGAAGLAF